MISQHIAIRPATCGDAEIRSRVERSASHGFFENRGFPPVKTQRVYEKLLEDLEETKYEE